MRPSSRRRRRGSLPGRRRRTALVVLALLSALAVLPALAALPAPSGARVDAGSATHGRSGRLPEAHAQTQTQTQTQTPTHAQTQAQTPTPTHAQAPTYAQTQAQTPTPTPTPTPTQRIVAARPGREPTIRDGIDYAHRDAANRRRLAADLGAARAARRASPRDPAARARVRSLDAIARAADARRHPDRALVSYVPGRDPLAAVSIGDLDAASHVTFAVPGMGTTTADMQMWAEAAQDLWSEQGEVGAPDDRAVVAWIGYHAPEPGIDATTGDHARRGAPLLAAAIQGLRAARAAGPRPTVDVVAHSYGSTMAADALAARDLGVRSFVMLGSAGVERAIPDAAALHVRRAYAAEAADDWDAIWGRLSRRDPRGAGFGATVFGVDGDDAEELLGVTGHAPVLHSAWNDDPSSRAWTRIADPVLRAQRYTAHQEAFGYLDVGTESLRNTAVATTPGARERLTHVGG